MADQILLVLSTFPDAETASRIAQTLVEEKLVACANLIPAVHSIYRWKEKIETAGEVMVFFKTTEDRLAAFEQNLRSLHPYEVPELICIKIDNGSPDYLRWVIDNCR
ncbi:MAG TPA: divalent-cation tolerance protein CutA [Candidatus Udaeobacter sp.]|jgi:periplasmic divalent cation tolerance protein|nr:divalent-cation tolerance protein CutA [Candidatus Udaeobacter sp.]